MSSLLTVIEQLKDSESFLRIEVIARNRSKRINRDVSLDKYLVDVCHWLDIVNERALTLRELYIFNELIARCFGSLLQQEMDDNYLRWK